MGLFLGAPRLVRTSRTPGRTQLLNLFMQSQHLAVVDLPGYGYAKLSHTQRQTMATCMRDYIAQRHELRGLVVVLDARRDEVTSQDRDMVAWALRHTRQVLLAFSKCDLVPKHKRLHQARRLEKSLAVPAGISLLCSSKSSEGLRELKQRLADLSAC